MKLYVRRRKYLIVIFGIAVFLLYVIFRSVFSGGKILSPVPEEDAIRIIFMTPTPDTRNQ